MTIGRFSFRRAGGGPMSHSAGDTIVAKTSPLEFIRQVQTETKKVVWPTWKETWMTGIMVAIMTTILAIFFFGIDSLFNAIVTALLSLAR
jgi:preprotein translocase subunit SecE